MMKRKIVVGKLFSFLMKGVFLIVFILGSNTYLLGQTNLYFEAESGILWGTAKVTSCNNASGGEMVRDIDEGGENALEIQGISIPEPGSYFVTISYFAVNERNALYKLNNNDAQTISLPASGELWCYEGGAPGDFTFKEDFLLGDNVLLFYDAPIIDKIIIRSDTSERQASVFYVSSSSGDDKNDGLTPASAWKTIDKVNVMPLVPGDSIRFRSGDVFKGKLSIVDEGGKKGLPLVIAGYGTGTKPLLDGDGYLSTIHIVNSGYIHLSDIEITNDGGPAHLGDPEDLRYGLYIENTHADGTTYEHYRFRNLNFINIYPTINVTDDDNTGVNAHAIITSGSWGDDVHPARFRDMRVENCYFTRTARHATLFKAIDSLLIRNNFFEHVGGAGMVIGNNCTNILVEHNVTDHTGSKIDSRMAGRGSGIWCFRSKNLTVQHNKFMYARGIHDSYGMHIDIGNRNVVYQYNYSEGNEGGFVEILGANVNVGYRYNLSVGDGWRKRGNRYGQIFWLAGWSGDPSNPVGSDSIFVYNNSIYVRDTIAPGIWIEEVSKNARIYNNIIYASNEFGPVVIKNQADLNDFNYNIWYGSIPIRDEDGDLYRGPKAMTSDPKYMSTIVSEPNGFVLQEGSPAIGSGMLINNAAIDHSYDYFHNNGGKDYYGNQVFQDKQPNIGAYNTGGDKLITGIMRTDTFGPNIIYPNPLKAGEELTVIVPTEIAFRSFSIHVTEMTGRTVYHKTTRNTDNFIIETTKFNKGCYIIRVYADQKYYGEKFIIQ